MTNEKSGAYAPDFSYPAPHGGGVPQRFAGEAVTKTPDVLKQELDLQAAPKTYHEDIGYGSKIITEYIRDLAVFLPVTPISRSGNGTVARTKKRSSK